MGERTGLLMGFLTVNWGSKLVREGKDTWFGMEFMSEKQVLDELATPES